MRKATVAVALMRSDAKCLLMAPTEMSFGFVAAMLNGWVNGVAVNEGIGKENIGWLIAGSTFCATASSSVFSWYSAKPSGTGCFVGKPGPMLTGAFAYICFSIVLYAVPVEDLGQWRFLVPLYIFQGVGRGNFESTNKAVFADFFPGPKAEAAFANFVIWSGLAMTAGFFLMPYLSKGYMALICLLAAVSAAVCYLVANSLYVRGKANSSGTGASLL